MRDYRQTQKAQFEKISINYKKMHSLVISATGRVLQEYYYPRCSGKRILDLGNGGQPPSKVLGEQIAATVKSFIALDNNIDMLKREDTKYIRVAGDGLYLPFKDKVFDYVLLNGVIHHLGFSSKEEQILRVKQLINEVFRVCIHQVIVNEVFTSRWLEWTERLIARILGHMSTFVFSEFTLDKYLSQIGTRRNEIISKKLSDLTSPFYWYLVIMDYEFFKLPAFLSPFRHIFFILSK